MKLTIDRSIERQLQGQQSALKRLSDLRRIAKENRDPPQTFFKPSGRGRSVRFEPYAILGLWHAKLDFSGAGGGDPLLVFQKFAAESAESDDAFIAIALTAHERYATSDIERCEAWLWENREAIHWSISPKAEDVLRLLVAKFG
jgi:hypothetical protein